MAARLDGVLGSWVCSVPPGSALTQFCLFLPPSSGLSSMLFFFTLHLAFSFGFPSLPFLFALSKHL